MIDNKTVIPEGWKRGNLSDLAIKMRSGGTPKSDNQSYYDGDIPFVAIEDLTNSNKYVDSTKKNISYQGLDNSSAWIIPPKSLLYSIYATLGIVRINNVKLATNQAILSIIPNENIINLDFFYYLLIYSKEEMISYSAQTTQSNLNAKIVKDFQVVFPYKISEQRQIASIFSKLDEAIAQTEQLIEKYKQIKIGLMHDLLTRGIDEQGNIRSEETHKFKDSALGRIPVEWECITIGDIIEQLRSGITPKGGSEVYQKEGVMLIRSQNVYPYGFELDDVAYISDKINNRMIGSELKEFDVLLNITGASIGRSNYVYKEFPRANVNQHVCSIRIKEPTEGKAIFVSSFLNSVYGQNQIMQHNAGSNRQGLNYSQIKQLYIPNFNNEYELMNFKITVTNIEKTINQYKDTLSKLSLQKSGLMHDLLSGKVRINCDEKKEIVPNATLIPLKMPIHNQHIEDAVLIAAIVNLFYSDKYPLGRKKVQKLLYLIRRHQEANVDCFKKKAAGPYADEIRYKGGEPIAIANKYIVTKSSKFDKGTATLFSKGEKIANALEYIEKWNMQSDIDWLFAQFKWTKVDELELIATVDMARCDLEKESIAVSLSAIKNLIATNKEWKAKLKKSYFDDLSIQRGIDESYKLFGNINNTL